MHHEQMLLIPELKRGFVTREAVNKMVHIKSLHMKNPVAILIDVRKVFNKIQ